MAVPYSRSHQHLMAPSGVLMIGIALVLRDLVQRRLGVAYSASAVVIGAILSALICAAVAGVGVGRGVFAVRVRRSRGLYAAGAARAGRGGGGVERCRADRRLDHLPWLAFGSLEFLLGQVVRQGLDGSALDSPWSMRCAAATNGLA